MQPLSYSPYDYAIHEDPYPTYRRLRAESPLYRNEELDFWALSRYSDVLAAFRDTARFSSRNGVSLDPSAYGSNAHKAMSFLAMDPPKHTRMRSLVSRALTPRRVADLEARIRQLAQIYVERAIELDSFDLVEALAGRLPMDVISEMIGVPSADRRNARHLADLMVHREDGVLNVPPAGLDAGLKLAVYFAEIIAERRKHRSYDLTSALIDAEIDGDHLNDDEIVSFLILMVVAGGETTTRLIGNAWYWAWRYPQGHDAVIPDVSCTTNWVEETLRFDASTQMLVRVANGDIPLEYGVIPDNHRVLLLVGSANRDPSEFPHADRYDIHRDTSKLISFGSGKHFCLGASLARLEARVALEELGARVADYDIDVDNAIRVHSINVRGFSVLPTSVTKR